MQGHVEQRHHGGAAARRSSVPILRIWLFGAILIGMAGCTASPYRWTQFNETNFPAKVDQIITEHGNLLDQRHRAGYGPWDVRAADSAPIATYICPPGETCQIVVDRLHCTNTHQERTECAVRLDVHKRICRLQLAEKKLLPIRCPLDVVLVREKPASATDAAAAPLKPKTLVQF